MNSGDKPSICEELDPEEQQNALVRLERNIAALEKRDSPLATILLTLETPKNAQLVFARDGVVTYRFFDRDGHSVWLGDSSVPRVAAEVMVSAINAGKGNLAMSGIGQGSEAKLLLEKILPYEALFVVEHDTAMLKLVLCLHDFSSDIENGCLVLLSGSNVAKLLEEFYLSHQGYGIVANVLRLARLSKSENEHFADQVSLAMKSMAVHAGKICEKLLAKQSPMPLSKNMEAIAKATTDDDYSGLRVINCTNTDTAIDYCTSRDSLAGLQALGAWTDWLKLDRPEVISHVAQLRRLDISRANIVLLVDMLRGDLGTKLPGQVVCATLLRNGAAAMLERGGELRKRMAECDFIFPSEIDDVAVLVDAGCCAERVAYLPQGVNVELFRKNNLSQADVQQYGCDVAVVANRPSIDPQAYGIRQETHEKLWQAIIVEIRRDPAAYCHGHAEELLQRAEHCGVSLHEDDLRQQFVALIQHCLGETIMRDEYCRTLANAGVNLRIWDWAPLHRTESTTATSQWKNSPVSDYVAGTIGRDESLNRLYNAAKIHLHISANGQLDALLLDGIAAGSFFLVRHCPTIKHKGKIGDLFQLGKELITFETTENLLEKLRYYLEHDDERQSIADLAQKKVIEQLDYRTTMRKMIEVVGIIEN